MIIVVVIIIIIIILIIILSIFSKTQYDLTPVYCIHNS